MFGFGKKATEKRKITYEKYTEELKNKMERVDNVDLRDKLGEVYDATVAMSVGIKEPNSRQDKQIKVRLSKILSITDKNYPDVKDRFDKDCTESINIMAGATKSAYKLNFNEKRKQQQRLAKEDQKKQLDEAIANVEQFNAKILELEAEVAESNLKIRKERDESKAVLILRQKKAIERTLAQQYDLKEKNERVITMAADEAYLAEQRRINESFDLKRLSNTAKEAARLSHDQKVNDRLYAELRGITDKNMALSAKGATADELAELKKVRKEVAAAEKEKVFDRADIVLEEIQEEYEADLEEDLT